MASRVAGSCLELVPTPDPHPFRWEEIEREPKAPKYCLARAHRTTEYELLHTGGFLRLCTERGRVYWLAQNEHDHRPPDWKIHFSVQPQHVPLAWDVLTRLFMDRGCDFGMKAVAAEALSDWPARQRGRELTVYIFQHDAAAYPEGGPMMQFCSAGTEHRFWLGTEFERDSDFWMRFVRDAELALETAGAASHGGAANGDLSLGGRYASLRNEAFIPLCRQGSRDMDYGYPPNEAGWNAAGHLCPVKLPLYARWHAALAAAAAALRCNRRRKYYTAGGD